jgi:hypothetical protein
MEEKKNPKPSQPKQISLPKSTTQSERLDFSALEQHVFLKDGDRIYIGGEYIEEDLLNRLKREAKEFKATRLHDIINCTIKDEAKNLALIQSKDWDGVIAGKMLYHWCLVMEKMLANLT